jgi:hypothetical protein
VQVPLLHTAATVAITGAPELAEAAIRAAAETAAVAQMIRVALAMLA